MKKIWLLALILAGNPIPLSGQRAWDFAPKIGRTELKHKGLEVGLELRKNKKIGLELTFANIRYKHKTPELFEGQIVGHYVERYVDSFFITHQIQITDPKGKFLGDGRPLPPAPEFESHSSQRGKIGYRFSHEKFPFRVFIQPGLQATRHLFYQIKTQLEVESLVSDSYETGNYPNDIRVTRKTYTYAQTRTMRILEKWVYGITYDAGVAVLFTPRLFLEGRLTGGMNLQQPFKPNAASRVRPFYLGVDFHAGYFF